MSLKRSPFAKPVYARPPRAPLTRAVRQGTYSTSGGVAAVPKERVLRSEAYRRWVAAQPCISCGIEGHSQCAHSNSPEHGKAKSLKASDQNTFPLCGPHGRHQGCHVLFDTGLDYTKEARRSLARRWVEMTQTRAHFAGWRFTLTAIVKP